MAEDPYAFIEASVALAGLRRGEFSAVDYVSALLKRIQQWDGHVHAFTSVSAEGALESARQADRRSASGRPLPPLHGLPFAVKDLIDLKGLPTGAGSRVPAVPAVRSAAVVLQLRRLGAICLGKLALDEFGIGSPLDEPTRTRPINPWNPCRATGGSSTGAGAALAAGLVPLAVGTDTRGSIRAPAANCGLVALKPTHGSVDMRGVVQLSPSLDVLAPIARSAADCALLATAMMGARAACEFAPATIGLVDTAAAGLVPDTDVVAAMGAALKVLESLGNRVGHATIPGIADAAAIAGIIVEYEAYAIHRQNLARYGSLYGHACRERLEAGAARSPVDHADAVQNRQSFTAQVDRLFETADVLALPAAFGAAPRLDDARGMSRGEDFSFRVPFSLSGHPAIVFCTGFNRQGLPLSMQLAGRRGEDQRLLDLVIAYQKVTSWHEMHPSDEQWRRP